MGTKKPHTREPEAIEDWELNDLDLAIGAGFASSFLTKRSRGPGLADDDDAFDPVDPKLTKG
ncbi:MAG: hypothetical protein AAGD47_05435 [Pseudomonadota bacterium]